jgi:hypothetical protein
MDDAIPVLQSSEQRLDKPIINFSKRTNPQIPIQSRSFRVRRHDCAITLTGMTPGWSG